MSFDEDQDRVRDSVTTVAQKKQMSGVVPDQNQDGRFVESQLTHNKERRTQLLCVGSSRAVVAVRDAL
jgi:hypothetical protein